MSQVPDWYGGVGAGWRPILEKLHLRLGRLDPDYQVSQVKEKFGTLRVYADATWSMEASEVDRKVFEVLVDMAEARSGQTCEFCGAPGAARGEGYWIKTACDGCAPTEERQPKTLADGHGFITAPPEGT